MAALRKWLFTGLLSAVFGMVAGSLAPQMVRNTRAPHHRVVGVE